MTTSTYWTTSGGSSGSPTSSTPTKKKYNSPRSTPKTTTPSKSSAAEIQYSSIATSRNKPPSVLLQGKSKMAAYYALSKAEVTSYSPIWSNWITTSACPNRYGTLWLASIMEGLPSKDTTQIFTEDTSIKLPSTKMPTSSQKPSKSTPKMQQLPSKNSIQVVNAGGYPSTKKQANKIG